jgi:hypothetical protein
MRNLLWAILAVMALPTSAFAAEHEMGTRCRPISERVGGDPGCWIIVNQPVGNLTKPQTFWHLDTYPTRALAEGAKGAHGAVAESLGKYWLLSIEDAGWRAPAGGERIAEIGPVPVENQIRTYSWCNPPRIGRQRMRPALFTVRDRGASLSKAKCVRVSL